MLSSVALLGATLLSVALPAMAQRPPTASVCDYYAMQLFGANTTEGQRGWIRRVVLTGFEGGTPLGNVSTGLTGIMRPGSFDNVNIDLMQYFNGSRASTNVNNSPIGINWLDQGGLAPLTKYLSDPSQDFVLANSSNQYHLFGNFLFAFSRAFGCTIPYPPLPNTQGSVSLAYAHKFMNLDNNQLGYFIRQLSLSAQTWGCSKQDANTFETRLNSLYNVRCAPAVAFSPAAPPQLLSLCQNPTCPLAAPVSDCDAYNNLTANGVGTKPTTLVQTATITGSQAPATSTSDSDSSAPSGGLSTGAIAGVAIGGAAVLVLALGLLAYFMRKRKTPPPPPPTDGTSTIQGWGGLNQQHTGGHFSSHSPTIDMAQTYDPSKGNHLSHISYYSGQQHPGSDMGGSSVHRTSRIGSPEIQGYQHSGGHHSHHHYSQLQPPVEIGGRHTPPAEMDGAGVQSPTATYNPANGLQSPTPVNYESGPGSRSHTPQAAYEPPQGHGQGQWDMQSPVDNAPQQPYQGTGMAGYGAPAGDVQQQGQGYGGYGQPSPQR